MILLIYVKLYSFYSGRNSLIDMTNPAEKRHRGVYRVYLCQNVSVSYTRTHTPKHSPQNVHCTVYTVHYIRVQYMLVLDENVNKLLINKLLRYGKKKKTTFRVNEAITL